MKAFVDDYCDKGPILQIKYSPDQMMWFIWKKHSKWSLSIDRGPKSAILRLIG